MPLDAAQTRREVLQRLVPKLKIAAQCSFEDKFLVVRGQRHTYKIHLGSGNILRSPNDRYLCIVPARGKAAADSAFLPFEGDGVLSAILSKALLLAADDKITDPRLRGSFEQRLSAKCKLPAAFSASLRLAVRYLFSTSSRFIIWFAIIVHVASSAGWSAASDLCSPSVRSFFASSAFAL